jgi:hypothetical protein
MLVDKCLREKLTLTREHARSSIQATGPPVLGALGALNDLNTITSFEFQIAIGLGGEVVERHDVVHRLGLGLERRWGWGRPLRSCCRRRGRRDGRGSGVWGRWCFVGGGSGGGCCDGSLPGAERGGWGRRGLLRQSGCGCCRR